MVRARGTNSKPTSLPAQLDPFYTEWPRTGSPPTLFTAILILIFNGFGLPAASNGCYDTTLSPYKEEEGR